MNELSPQDSLLVDKYLRGQLSDDELFRFDQRINDPLFKQEVGFRSALVEISQEKGDEKLYDLLEQESRRMDRQKPKKKYKLYWGIIALLAIAGLFYFLFIHKTLPTNEELFLAHYEVFPNLIAPTERSNTENLNGVALALSYYDNKSYANAVAVFDTLSSMNSELMLYYAISCRESGDDNLAKELLVTLVQNPNAKYREAAEWYSCLIYLKESEMERFNKLIRSIESDEKHKYYARANQLSKDL